MKTIPLFLILLILTMASLIAIPMEGFAGESGEKTSLPTRTRMDAVADTHEADERDREESTRSGDIIDETDRATTLSIAAEANNTSEETRPPTLSIGKLDEFITVYTEAGYEERFLELSAAQRSAIIACHAELELQSALATAEYDQAVNRAEAVIAAWKEAAAVFQKGLTTASEESKKAWNKDLCIIDQLTSSAEALQTKITAEQATALVKATIRINKPYDEVLPLLIEHSSATAEAWTKAAAAFQTGHDKALQFFQPWWKSRLEEINNSESISKINKLYWQTKNNELAAHKELNYIPKISHECAIVFWPEILKAIEKAAKGWTQITRNYQRGLEQAPEAFKPYWSTQFEKATIEKNFWNDALTKAKRQKKENLASYEEEILATLDHDKTSVSAAIELANTIYKKAQTLNKRSKIEALPLWHESITKAEKAIASCSMFMEERSQPVQHASESFKNIESQILQVVQGHKSELEKLLIKSKKEAAISLDIQKQKEETETRARESEAKARDQALNVQLKPFQLQITTLQNQVEKSQRVTAKHILQINEASHINRFPETRELWNKVAQINKRNTDLWHQALAICENALKIAPETKQTFWKDQRTTVEKKLFLLEVANLSNRASQKETELKESILHVNTIEREIGREREWIDTDFDQLHLLWSQIEKATEATASAWEATAGLILSRSAHIISEEKIILQQHFEESTNKKNSWNTKKISMEINRCKVERNKMIYQAKAAPTVTEALPLWDQVFQKHAEGSEIYLDGLSTIFRYTNEAIPRFKTWWNEELLRITNHSEHWNEEATSLKEVKEKDLLLKSTNNDEASTGDTSTIASSLLPTTNEDNKETTL